MERKRAHGHARGVPEQFRPVLNAVIYELPAGTLQKKEAHLVCARRELVEETGYAARYMRLIGSIYPVPGYSTERIWIYRASVLSDVGQFCVLAMGKLGARELNLSSDVDLNDNRIAIIGTVSRK